MNKPTILLVDDEETVRSSVSQTLELADFEVISFSSAKDVLPHLSDSFYGVVISDIRMPEMDGLALLDKSLEIDPKLPFILISGHADVSIAVNAIRQGAYDVIEKPFSNMMLVDKVKRALNQRELTLENRKLKEELASQTQLGPRIIGKTPSITNLRLMISRIADTNADVLIMGETGTGKELVARSLHEQSSRSSHNFVAINCGAIQEQLLNSELFGHEVGAFTDAKQKRIGKFEHANSGTIFLDEIESMPLTTQIPLLRVLQERSLERLGSNKSIPLDIRVLAATKTDLKEASEKNEFREDLYYRLNVVTLELPPLRERKEDIPMLFQHFLLIATARSKTEMPKLDSNALKVLLDYEWPGNVRELRNIAERFVLLGDSVHFDLNEIIKSEPIESELSLSKQLSEYEKTLLEKSLIQNKGNLTGVMESLDIPRRTLSDKLNKYNLNRKDYI